MLTKQYTVTLIFPLYFTFLQASDPEFVTPVSSAVREESIADADTIPFDLNAQPQRKVKFRVVDGTKRNLASELCEIYDKDKVAQAEDVEDIKPWTLDETPAAPRGAERSALVSSVTNAHKTLDQVRTGPVKNLLARCRERDGNGEWALYYSITQNTPDIFAKLLDLGYSYKQFFPLSTVKRSEDDKVEGLLIAALRLKYLEHARILIDRVENFSFFYDQVERSRLCDADWDKVVESVQLLRKEAKKLKDKDLQQLSLYLCDLIKRKRQGAVHYYSSSIYRSVVQDIHAIVGAGKRLASKAFTYAPFIGLAGVIAMLLVRDMRAVYMRQLNIQARILAEASSSYCDITEYT